MPISWGTIIQSIISPYFSGHSQVVYGTTSFKITGLLLIQEFKTIALHLIIKPKLYLNAMPLLICI